MRRSRQSWKAGDVFVCVCACACVGDAALIEEGSCGGGMGGRMVIMGGGDDFDVRREGKDEDKGVNGEDGDSDPTRVSLSEG